MVCEPNPAKERFFFKLALCLRVPLGAPFLFACLRVRARRTCLASVFLFSDLVTRWEFVFTRLVYAQACCPQHGESLLLARGRPVTNPHRVGVPPLQVANMGRLLTGSIPIFVGGAYWLLPCSRPSPARHWGRLGQCRSTRVRGISRPSSECSSSPDQQRAPVRLPLRS